MPNLASNTLLSIFNELRGNICHDIPNFHDQIPSLCALAYSSVGAACLLREMMIVIAPSWTWTMSDHQPLLQDYPPPSQPGYQQHPSYPPQQAPPQGGARNHQGIVKKKKTAKIKFVFLFPQKIIPALFNPEIRCLFIYLVPFIIRSLIIMYNCGKWTGVRG